MGQCARAASLRQLRQRIGYARQSGGLRLRDLGRSSRLDEIRPTYQFTELCRGPVPQALIAFLEATDYEAAIGNAISLGGDTDTLACITGGIAEAYYGGIPEHLAAQVRSLLDARLLDVVDRFRARFSLP